MLRSAYLKAEPLLLRIAKPLMRSRRARSARSALVEKYCRGSGAEIGAGVQPMLIPLGSSVKYIDAEKAEFWRDYPLLMHEKVVDADIIDDGQTLATIADGSFDFLLAAHVLEHVENPILALKNWVRVVKPGGHLVIAVPDKRIGDEADRPLTTVEHFRKDYFEGGVVSRAEHCEELGIPLDEHDEQRMMIHYHTFTLVSFIALLGELEAEMGFDLLEACFNVNEDIAVLRRRFESSSTVGC